MKYTRKKFAEHGNYIIYNDGRVFSKKKGIFLTPILGTGKHQYYSVKVPKTISLHRLVALYFCHNRFNKPHVNHKDGNKLNNHWRNLEWVTFQENVDHANKNGLTNYLGRAVLTPLDLTVTREAISKGHTLASIARYYKVHPTTIWAVKHGKSWSSL